MDYQGRIFNIAVCDDEPIEAKQIMEMTKRILKEEGIKYELFYFDSSYKLLESFCGKQSFDILLLDVMMPGQDGMELA